MHCQAIVMICKISIQCIGIWWFLWEVQKVHTSQKKILDPSNWFFVVFIICLFFICHPTANSVALNSPMSINLCFISPFPKLALSPIWKRMILVSQICWSPLLADQLSHCWHYIPACLADWHVWTTPGTGCSVCLPLTLWEQKSFIFISVHNNDEICNNASRAKNLCFCF